VIARFEMPETKIKWSTKADGSEKGIGCIKSGKGKCQ
jgi:hypothetical protein